MKKTFKKIADSVMAATLAVVTVMYLCSCNSKENNDDYLIKNIPSNQYNLVSNTYENGVIYISYENESKYANFLDYETGQSVPLCNKPSCVHKDSSCLAFACLNKNPMVVAYQNSIIWFSSDVQIVDSEDGKSQTADINTTCWIGNLKTGEVKKFTEIPDVCMDSAKQIVIVNNILYVIGCESAYQTEDGSWVQVSNIGNQYLYSIDLANAEVKNYGLINDAPTANYNWTLNGVMYAGVELSGVYNNKLYMSYRYVDEPSDIIDYVESKDASDPDWSDADTAIPWNKVNKCLNLETYEIEVSDLPATELIEDNSYIYYDGNFNIIDNSGNVTTSPNITTDEYTNATFVNEKLWKGSQNLCFDIKSKEDAAISKKFCDKNITVLAYYDDKYIVYYTDDEGKIYFEFVSEDELIGE